MLLIAASESGAKLASIKTVLAIVAIVFLLHGASIRFWNYAFYTGAIAAGVLLAEDLPHPSNYSAGADRVLWTLVGVAIAVLVIAPRESARQAHRQSAAPSSATPSLSGRAFRPKRRHDV